MQTEAINEFEGIGSRVVKNNSIIFGLGATGLSVARFLSRSDERFVLVDTRDIPPNIGVVNEMFPDCQKYLGTADHFDFANFDQLIISPGLSRTEALVIRAIEEGMPVIGDIELFYRHAKAPIIAVTGSNGKSSVVTLVSDILKASGYSVRCGGNIGIPALDLLRDPSPDFYVLEVSSFQLESVQDFAPRIAAILNLSADHMDRYENFEDYVGAKLNIAAKAKHVVIHYDELSRLPNTNSTALNTFSGDPSVPAHYKVRDREGMRFLGVNDERAVAIESLKLKGAHNVENALAAIAITDLAGATSEAQATALSNFSGLEHRTELVGIWDDVTWVNDSKGTNVGASVAAINGVLEGGEGILIAGGVGKGADFAPLRSTVESRVAVAILFGRDAGELATALEGATQLHIVADLNAAVRLAKSLAKSGTKILFSPACSSFDMFADFQQRGTEFKALVAQVNKS